MAQLTRGLGELAGLNNFTAKTQRAQRKKSLFQTPMLLAMWQDGQLILTREWLFSTYFFIPTQAENQQVVDWPKEIASLAMMWRMITASMPAIPRIGVVHNNYVFFAPFAALR